MLFRQLGGEAGPFINVQAGASFYLTGDRFDSFRMEDPTQFGSWWSLTGLHDTASNTLVHAQGDIVMGYAWLVHDGDVGAAVSPIPEPSTYALMLAGLVGFMAKRRQISQRSRLLPT